MVIEKLERSAATGLEQIWENSNLRLLFAKFLKQAFAEENILVGSMSTVLSPLACLAQCNLVGGVRESETKTVV